jgi:hypothetical protein
MAARLEHAGHVPRDARGLAVPGGMGDEDA